MKVLKASDQTHAKATGELYVGDGIGFALLAGAPDTDQVEIYTVSFQPGERNRVHCHKMDQVLIATQGIGIIADSGGEQIMRPGDVVTIPAGHPHWHGATADSSFTHITVAKPGDAIEIVDQDPRGSWGALESRQLREE